jgi:hypothetical protein
MKRKFYIGKMFLQFYIKMVVLNILLKVATIEKMDPL